MPANESSACGGHGRRNAERGSRLPALRPAGVRVLRACASFDEKAGRTCAEEVDRSGRVTLTIGERAGLEDRECASGWDRAAARVAAALFGDRAHSMGVPMNPWKAPSAPR